MHHDMRPPRSGADADLQGVRKRSQHKPWSSEKTSQRNYSTVGAANLSIRGQARASSSTFGAHYQTGHQTFVLAPVVKENPDCTRSLAPILSLISGLSLESALCMVFDPKMLASFCILRPLESGLCLVFDRQNCRLILELIPSTEARKRESGPTDLSLPSPTLPSVIFLAQQPFLTYSSNSLVHFYAQAKS